MKKWFSLSLLFLLTFLSASIALGSDGESNKTLSWGLGIPYGVIGCNLEIKPCEYVGLTGGIGISPDGLGWSLGSRVYLMSKEARVRPRLGIYYGTNTYIEYFNGTYEAKKGTSAGFGMDIKINDRCAIDTEIINILSYEDEDDPRIISDDSHIKISVGFRKAF